MLNLFLDRLKDKAQALASVEILENLAALENMTAPDSGATFVIPFRERGAPNKVLGGVFRQQLTVQVMVAFAIRSDDDPSGSERISGFDTYKRSILGAVVGWRPERESRPCELVSGEATPLNINTAVYVQIFETTYFLKGTDQ